MDNLTQSIAYRIRRERTALSWSLGDLAQRSDVSKAMISKIERAETSATAVVLGKLAGAFGLTLSAFLVDEADQAGRLSRAGEQLAWIDPATGYQRTLVSPRAGGPIEVVKVSLPGGARVPFPASAYASVHQLIWVLSGRLRFTEGSVEHCLEEGDSLELGPPADCIFKNDMDQTSHYAIIMSRRR